MLTTELLVRALIADRARDREARDRGAARTPSGPRHPARIEGRAGGARPLDRGRTGGRAVPAGAS